MAEMRTCTCCAERFLSKEVAARWLCDMCFKHSMPHNPRCDYTRENCYCTLVLQRITEQSVKCASISVASVRPVVFRANAPEFHSTAVAASSTGCATCSKEFSVTLSVDPSRCPSCILSSQFSCENQPRPSSVASPVATASVTVECADCGEDAIPRHGLCMTCYSLRCEEEWSGNTNSILALRRARHPLAVAAALDQARKFMENWPLSSTETAKIQTSQEASQQRARAEAPCADCYDLNDQCERCWLYAGTHRAKHGEEIYCDSCDQFYMLLHGDTAGEQCYACALHDLENPDTVAKPRVGPSRPPICSECSWMRDPFAVDGVCSKCRYHASCLEAKQRLNDIRDEIENIQEKLTTDMSPAQKADWQHLLDVRKKMLADAEEAEEDDD